MAWKTFALLCWSDSNVVKNRNIATLGLVTESPDKCDSLTSGWFACSNFWRVPWGGGGTARTSESLGLCKTGMTALQPSFINDQHHISRTRQIHKAPQSGLQRSVAPRDSCVPGPTPCHVTLCQRFARDALPTLCTISLRAWPVRSSVLQ